MVIPLSPATIISQINSFTFEIYLITFDFKFNFLIFNFHIYSLREKRRLRRRRPRIPLPIPQPTLPPTLAQQHLLLNPGVQPVDQAPDAPRKHPQVFSSCFHRSKLLNSKK